jgi:hypothetical protein
MNSFLTYFCYEEFFTSISDEKNLIKQIARYDAFSILKFIARLNTELLIWSHGIPTDHPKYLSTVHRLLPNILGEQLIYSLRHRPPEPLPSRAFFHTRQLLYLVKIALRYCQFGHGLLFGQHGIEASLILLKINDHLHIKDREGANNSDVETRDYAILSEFVAINEFTGTDPGDIALRAYQMLFELAADAKDQPFYIDLDATFSSQTGISLERYFAMCFSLFVSTTSPFYKRIDSALTFMPNTWSKSSLPLETITKFWEQVSIAASNAKKHMANDHGNNDVTLFRKWPLIEHQGVRFGFDSTFFMEKLWAGPFWTVFYSSDEAKQKLPQLTGWLFERYLNRLLERTCGKPTNGFIPEPKKRFDEQKELCDGIVICGDSLVLIEYKSVMFTAQAKYSGDREILRDELEKKLLRNERGKPKGVAQLNNAVEYLNARDLKQAVIGVDLSGIKKVYPLLVTLEALGDGLIVSRVLNREFEKLRGEESNEKFIVKRLHCTGIATIERICGAFRNSSIALLLDEWDENDSPLRGCWKLYFDQNRHATEKLFNKPLFQQLEDRILPLLELHD